MCEIHYDRIEEKYLVRDPDRGLKFWAVSDSPKAVIRLKKLWRTIVDAISTTTATTLKIRGEYVTLIPDR